MTIVAPSLIAAVVAAPAPLHYSFALQVEIAPQAAAARYDHEGWGTFDSPPGEPSTTFAGKQALAEYRAIAGRLFDPQATARARLLIEAVRPRVVLENDGWHAVVDHVLVLTDEDGALLGRWSVEGRGRVEGLGEGSLPAAFEGAAALAAQRFEADFETPPQVAAFIERHGVGRGVVKRRPPGEEFTAPRTPRRQVASRPGLVAYLGVGSSLHPMTFRSGTRTATGSPSDDLVDGLDARLGVSGRAGFAQLVFDRWNNRDGILDHSSTSIGVDAGLVRRLSDAFELAVGLSLHARLSKVTASTGYPQPLWVEAWHTEPGVVGMLHIIAPLKLPVRVTLEVRAAYASTDTILIQPTAYDGLVEHSDAATSIAVLIGGELGLGRVSR